MQIGSDVCKMQSYLNSLFPPHPPAVLLLLNNSVFGANSANVTIPWAVPNTSSWVRGLLSVKLNSLTLNGVALGQLKGLDHELL